MRVSRSESEIAVDGAAPRVVEQPAEAHGLTDVVARLRRVLRSSIRSDYPWESLPDRKSVV